MYIYIYKFMVYTALHNRSTWSNWGWYTVGLGTSRYDYFGVICRFACFPIERSVAAEVRMLIFFGGI